METGMTDSRSDDPDEIDRAIAAYRAQLTAEAELARADLDEIEDHIRTLAAELRGRGLGATEAVAEAARRLGDPRSVAREHARVRTAFGARLSRTRAWAAALLIAPLLVAMAVSGAGNTDMNAELGVGVLIVLALVARLSWARPILLGGFAFFTLPTAMWLFSGGGASPWWVAWFVGIVALLAPWHRRELGAAGAALALQVWAFGAASLALAYQYSSRDGRLPVAPAANLAVIAAALATAGGVLRARWAAIGSAIAAIALAVALEQMWGLRFRFAHPELYSGFLFSAIGSGAIASAASAVLGWRSAPSRFGSLRALFDRA
jgi:hypothetical protein